MKRLQVVIDSEEELEHFKVNYWVKAQKKSAHRTLNSIMAISYYRVHKVKKLDMSYEEFLLHYNQDRLIALTKLFLQPVHKSDLKLLDEKLGTDSVEILYKLHKLQPSQILFTLINQYGTLKDRYERDLEYSKRESFEYIEETPFFESNVYVPILDIEEEDKGFEDAYIAFEENIGFEEGRKKIKQHIIRERNQKVIKLAKERFKDKHGRLFCEICTFDFYERYGHIGEDFIEGHHTVPVSELEERQKTMIEDIALVCSNCHKMLHRRRPWLKKEELKKLLQR
ncbi:HNH endonuclease [Peribacillus butanolivorans]